MCSVPERDLARAVGANLQAMVKDEVIAGLLVAEQLGCINAMHQVDMDKLCIEG